jgi:hypothetical protein
VILQRNLPMESYLYEPGGSLRPNPSPEEALKQQALAHSLWPVMMIRDKAYRPMLRRQNGKND